RLSNCGHAGNGAPGCTADGADSHGNELRADVVAARGGRTKAFQRRVSLSGRRAARGRKSDVDQDRELKANTLVILNPLQRVKNPHGAPNRMKSWGFFALRAQNDMGPAFCECEESSPVEPAPLP